MIKYIFLATFQLLATFVFADHCPTFQLDGVIDADSGTVVLIPIGEPYYYANHQALEAAVVHHSFSLADSIAYPTAFKLGLRMRGQLQYSSGMFFLEPCHQVISINTKELDRNVPDIGNPTMAEWNGAFTDAMQAAKTQKDFTGIVERWGVRRSNPAFWSVFHDFTTWIQEHEPVEASILDMNRYENL